MTEIKQLWDDRLPLFPESDIETITAAAREDLAPACCCFWLFRYLHRHESPEAVLLGDYSFGRFSAHLAALDSVALTDNFAEYLKNDVLFGMDLESYLDFIRLLPEIMRHDHT